MHNYVHSASAFERQRREEARRGEGAGEGREGGGGRNGLIVSRAERRQYRCPSYNQQRATRQEEEKKKKQNKTVK